MVANRIAGVGARESTRQQRRHTPCEFAQMWLAAVALVALAAQECSGLQFSGHIACRSPAFAPHLALSPAVTKTLSSHHNIQRLQALGVLLRSGSIGLGLTFLARLMAVLRAERDRGIFEVASEKSDAQETVRTSPALHSQQCAAAKHMHALTCPNSEFLHLGLSDSNFTPTHLPTNTQHILCRTGWR